MQDVKDEVVSKDSLDSIQGFTTKIFEHPGQLKRFRIGNDNPSLQELKEIYEECQEKKHTLHLAQNSSWVELDIHIKTNTELSEGQELVQIGFVVFSLWVGRQYPIRDIRVHCRTTFVKPSLADGRNLIFDVLYGNWSYKNSLVNIVKKLPQFLERVIMYSKDRLYLQNLGQYYIGSLYSITELKEFPDLTRFPAIQLSNAFFQSISVRYHIFADRLIGLSDSHYYLFEFAENQQQEKLKLIFRAPLQCCTQIKRRRDSSAEVTLTWRNYKSKQEEQHIFKINEFDVFIRVFLRRLNHFSNIRMTSNSYLLFGDHSKEEQTKINDILRQTSELEMQIEKKFNFEHITRLMDLYQYAIEFYSAANDYLQEVYLNKLQSLIQREDVQVVLQINKEKV